ncbi:hypothetical protein V0R50_09135 [Pseudomonas sp. 148P]|uniref:Uncharacterized protein n=1 Tax=Pseudomonas ulcerans TaxID=3115852 RepID=A0ABU7HPC0_9PSED|nr:MULTISPECIES: hypothetical protein [unclassified Pseudomonas]MEE1920604.1 hypothetical protein [Pseudomonas sp. 147P]MEE1933386.1 hypothetical protein [Pseudomonas sp. 148P]
MSQSEQQRLAEQSRSAFRKAQVQRHRTRQDLAPPTLAAGIIVDPEDGTLDKNALLNDLAVTIQAYDSAEDLYPGDIDTVYLEWAEAGSGDFEVYAQTEVTPPLEGVFPLTLHLPKEQMEKDGAYDLRYRVHQYNDEQAESPPLTVICDGTAPWGWTDEEPPAMVMPDVPITDQYLTDNPAGVVGTIPDYADRQPKDFVVYWWLKDPIPEDITEIDIAGYHEVTGTPAQITVDPSVVQAVGDGGCYLAYALIDKAHNRSRISFPTPVAVALGPLPTNLAPPEVPLASDGLINLMDAYLGVVVHIPLYAGWKATDRVEVKWGATDLYAEDVGSQPGPEIQVRVPSATLRAEYGDATGIKNTSVSYRILRGTVPFDAPAAQVDVDFSYIGPPRPEPDLTWPDPVNGDLTQLDTYGATDNTFNHLTREDSGQPAKQNTYLFAGAQVDDFIEFYWGDELAFTYTVAGFEQPGDEIAAQIPWEVIQRKGNGAQVPVHYRIGSPTSNNKQHSKTYHVLVEAVVLTPPAPQYLGLNPANGWLTCVSLYEDPANPHPLEPCVRVQVPDLSQWLQEGDTVTLTWTPWDRRAPGEGQVITDAILEEPIVLDAEHPATGFIWRVPYEEHILPIYQPGTSRDGRGVTTYTFTHEGEPVTSLEVEAAVSMHIPGASCPIPPPVGRK